MFHVHKSLDKFIGYYYKAKNKEKFHMAFMLLFSILEQYYFRKVIFFQDILSYITSGP
jgi:hypothetical protein